MSGTQRAQMAWCLLLGAFCNAASLFFILFPYAVYRIIIPNRDLALLVLWTCGLVGVGVAVSFASHLRRSAVRHLGDTLFRTACDRAHLTAAAGEVSALATRAAAEFVRGPSFLAAQDIPWSVVIALALFEVHSAAALAVVAVAGLSVALGWASAQAAKPLASGAAAGEQRPPSRLAYDVAVNIRSAFVMVLCCALVLYDGFNAGLILVMILSARKLFRDFDRLPTLVADLAILRAMRKPLADQESVTSATTSPSPEDLSVLLYRQPGRNGLAPIELRLDVSSARLLTISGPSGSGKTRIAREFYEAMRHVQPNRTTDPFHYFNGLDLSTTFGYLPQSLPKLAGTVQDHLRFVVERLSAQDAAGAQRAIAVMERAGPVSVLRAAARAPRGVRRQLCLLHALLVRPRLLLMDEQSDELDLVGRGLLHFLMTSRASSSLCTIVLTKHPDALLSGTHYRLLPAPIGYCVRDRAEPSGAAAPADWSQLESAPLSGPVRGKPPGIPDGCRTSPPAQPHPGLCTDVELQSPSESISSRRIDWQR